MPASDSAAAATGPVVCLPLTLPPDYPPIQAIRCFCGAANCRGWIGGSPNDPGAIEAEPSYDAEAEDPEPIAVDSEEELVAKLQASKSKCGSEGRHPSSPPIGTAGAGFHGRRARGAQGQRDPGGQAAGQGGQGTQQARLRRPRWQPEPWSLPQWLAPGQQGESGWAQGQRGEGNTSAVRPKALSRRLPCLPLLHCTALSVSTAARDQLLTDRSTLQEEDDVDYDSGDSSGPSTQQPTKETRRRQLLRRIGDGGDSSGAPSVLSSGRGGGRDREVASRRRAGAAVARHSEVYRRLVQITGGTSVGVREARHVQGLLRLFNLIDVSQQREEDSRATQVGQRGRRRPPVHPPADSSPPPLLLLLLVVKVGGAGGVSRRTNARFADLSMLLETIQRTSLPSVRQELVQKGLMTQLLLVAARMIEMEASRCARGVAANIRPANHGLLPRSRWGSPSFASCVRSCATCPSMPRYSAAPRPPAARSGMS